MWQKWCIVQLPKVVYPQKIQTPDFLIDGKRFDLKSPTGWGKDVLYNMVKGKYKQADNFVFDISNYPLTEDDLVEQAKRLFTSKYTKFIDSVILMKKDKVLMILKRK